MTRLTRALGDSFGSWWERDRPGSRRKAVGRRSKFTRPSRTLCEPALLTRSAIFQPLEERVMLDIGGANSLPPTMVVGRTLSAYDVPDVQNNQEKLTFTVYNQAADPITGVLLTDTLANGVTFASASQLPDQNGQQLAWSLGTIQPYDRVSVTLTVSLATPTPTQLDAGANAYGTLDAGMVTWTTAPATLRTTAIAADLLASTPDANTTDPYVQEKAAELNYDPTQIYNFLHTQIGYNSYVGSLRGARGTLWSNAGNSLDDASLGVALMRASGIPARYQQGTLSQSQAQQLILSMFPASYQTVGYIPAGTQTSDPADDPQLLSETENHFWFQFDSASGMKDADPEFAGQTIGQAATTSTSSFTEVPQSLRQTTEVSLTAEMYNQAAAALTGGNGLTDTVVLDQTFNDVDLVGHPLTIGNYVQTTGPGAIFSTQTNTYSPYIQVGDDAFPDVESDQIIRGQDYQEVISSFPLGGQILSGLFLNITANVPGSSPEHFEHTVVDRIGFAARTGGIVSPLNVAPTDPPILSHFDVVTIDASPGIEDPSSAAHAADELNRIGSSFGALASADQAEKSNDVVKLAVDADIEQTRAVADALLIASQGLSQRLADISLVKVYASEPRIFLVSNKAADTTTSSPGAFSVDLLSDTFRTVVDPGQETGERVAFNVQYGVLENVIETEVPAQILSAVSSTPPPATTATIFLAAQAAGVPLTTITQANVGLLDALAIPAEAKARISLAIHDGKAVVVPTKSVTVSGVSTIGWYEIDPSTGDTVGVIQDGTHCDQFLFYAVLGTLTALLILGLAP
ncbi:MAG TPA: transglutaminase domain-containing protein, partial [Pirellulales bacterium]|nr:transglutaminase domain-containing protein [Pirellulales bacterium]